MKTEIWEGVIITEVSNTTIKVGDLIARDPDLVYPVINAMNQLLYITNCWEVVKIKQSIFEWEGVETNQICFHGSGENMYKRFEGKPVYLITINNIPQ